MTTIEPIKKSALADQIANQLLSLIKEKLFRPGDKLPQERKLAEMMGVSRPSLREALRTLSIMNVIEIRQGDGSYVSSLEPKRLVEHLAFVFSLDESTAEKLFESRKIVEIGIASLAAQRITDEQIEKLEALMKKLVDKEGDHESFVLADLKMHELIADAADNTILARFMQSISQLSLASRRYTVRKPGIFRRTIKDHRRIVKALKARDPEAACDAMLTHLNHVEQASINLFKLESRKP